MAVGVGVAGWVTTCGTALLPEVVGTGEGDCGRLIWGWLATGIAASMSPKFRGAWNPVSESRGTVVLRWRIVRSFAGVGVAGPVGVAASAGSPVVSRETGSCSLLVVDCRDGTGEGVEFVPVAVDGGELAGGPGAGAEAGAAVNAVRPDDDIDALSVEPVICWVGGAGAG